MRFLKIWIPVLAALSLAACSSPSSPALPVGMPKVLPEGIFGTPVREEVKIATPGGPAALPATRAVRKPAEEAWPQGPAAYLYVSSASQAYLTQNKVDPSSSVRVWESFLRKYRIPMVRISQVAELAKVPPQGVLILPATVALASDERDAIQALRVRGGAILSTWLTGVRDEKGNWTGFDFMEKVLQVKVTGDTEKDAEDNFMIVHGDTPVLHGLPAGTRVWLDRVPNAWPLRLAAEHEAAQIMGWDRTLPADRKTGLIAYGEAPEPGGASSRAVTLGYPEQVWAAADPRQLELIAYDAVTWLFRQPAAYLATWPHPYTGAVLMAIQSAEEFADVDADFLKQLEAAGGLATVYVHGGNVAKAAPVIRKVQARQHEIACFGDKFEGFTDQPQDVQADRLVQMRRIIAAAGITLPANAGFSAPLDAYDKTTVQLLQQQRVDHFLSFMELTDSRVPSFLGSDDDHRRSTVVLPRTLRGPEEVLEDDDPDQAMANFLQELTLSEQMAALSVIRLPAQSLLTPEQRGEILDHLRKGRDHLWVRTAAQIAQWWRDRDRISVEMAPDEHGILLKVTVVATYTPKLPVAVWLNLPRPGARLRLESPDPTNPTPPVVTVDAWRSAVLLQELVPGEYDWYVHFDGPAAAEAAAH